MPQRNTLLETNNYYHVFNRGVAKQNIFSTQSTYKRFLSCVSHYRFLKPAIRLSDFLETEGDIKNSLLAQTKKSGLQIEILAYCLMPNHYHLLLKQLTESGISDFIRKSMNSYSSYYNKLNERCGPLFQGPFKAVKVKTNEQLMHVSRYIHLNPYFSRITKLKDVFDYPWSSVSSYTSSHKGKLIDHKDIKFFFSNPTSYKMFLSDEVDYKNSLLDCKSLYMDAE